LLTFDPTRPVGCKGRQPAVGKFSFADNRLLLGSHLRQPRAFARNLVAHLRELCFEMGGRGEPDERAFSVSFGGCRFVAARIKPRTGFGQRR
jgi:hypothetical protein